ncbi:MAG: hypothetical protein QM723_15990 [Myxococcaceae bacterium]
MHRVIVVALTLSLCACDCSTGATTDGGDGGGGGGNGGGSAVGGGTGGGTTDAGSGCQWSLIGTIALSGTCGAEPAVGYTQSFDTLAVELDTDANVTIGTFKFAAEKSGLQSPANLDPSSASAYGGTLTRLSDGARWEATNVHSDGTFQLMFSDGGTPQAVAAGTKFVSTHGQLDVTLVPVDGGSNPATGNETFHASW